MTDDSLSKAEYGLSESPQFIHLRVHSAYSLLEGALPVKKIIAKAVADDQPALGLTDTNNLFAALEFSKTASGEGLQPIIGCQLSIDMEEDVGEERTNRQPQLKKHPAIVMLAANAEGYYRLSHLVSRAYMEGEGGHGAIHIKRSWLARRSGRHGADRGQQGAGGFAARAPEVALR